MRSLEGSELKLISGGSADSVAISFVLMASTALAFCFTPPRKSYEAEIIAGRNAAELVRTNFQDTMATLSDAQQGHINAYISQREGYANTQGWLEARRPW